MRLRKQLSHFQFWRLQFTKVVCHTIQERFSKQRNFCLFAWGRSVIEVLPHLAVEKFELHTVHFTIVISSKLTSSVNGNSTFTEDELMILQKLALL
jgi:hypothetical protein